MPKLKALAAAALLCALLAACGGGDDEQKDTEPVDCEARPELCV